MNIRRLFYILTAGMVLLLSGCEILQRNTQPAGFRELIEAHEAGKVFSSATRQGGACMLHFADGYTLS